MGVLAEAKRKKVKRIIKIRPEARWANYDQAENEAKVVIEWLYPYLWQKVGRSCS